MNKWNGDLTEKALDEIAVNHNGCLGSAAGPMPYGVVHGYRFNRIKTKGTADGGIWVLTAASARTSKLLEQGKLTMLNKVGFHKSVTKRVYDVIKTIKHGLRPDVLSYAVLTMENPDWLTYPTGISNKHFWLWFNNTTLPETTLTPARLEAVYQIVKTLSYLKV